MIAENGLTGSIPTEVGLLAELASLMLGKQLFSDLLLNYLKQTDSLHASNFYLSPLLFHIADNELKGSIPSELGSLKSLQRLHLGMYILSI